jgi:hypothetical protein
MDSPYSRVKIKSPARRARLVMTEWIGFFPISMGGYSVFPKSERLNIDKYDLI